MKVQASRKVTDWLPQILVIVLGFVLPAMTPVVRDAILSFIANNPEWSTVIGTVVGFIFNVLPAPVALKKK